MNRFHLLGLISAVLIPLLLPEAGQRPDTLGASSPAGEETVTEVSVARIVPPASLREALARAAEGLPEDLDEQARCLAQAVYFEARSEPLEGQLAVAQVVLNRVRSAFWPNDICSVVFQNEHRRHGCQFSFACDGLSDNPHNPRAWQRSKLVAAVALQDLWDDVTGAATHYHADYVAPEWRRAMDPTVRYGRHLFYRDDRRAVVLNADYETDG